MMGTDRPCVYDGKTPTQPFTEDFDFPVCRECGILQHEALERIAELHRPLKWSAPPELLKE